MRRIRRNIVSALIFSKDGKLFQGMKNPLGGGVYSDCWHIPGGGTDVGENLVQALQREIQEETGIDITPYNIELVDDAGLGESRKVLKTGEEILCAMKFHVYKIIIDNKNSDEIIIRLNDDLIKFRWVDVGELRDIKLTPPSKALFKN